MLPKNCPLCNSSSDQSNVITRHVYGQKSNEYAFYKCGVCTVSYLWPQLTETESDEFYKKEFETFMDSRHGGQSWLTPDEHIKVNHNTFKRRLEYLKPFIKENASVLEIGSSSGFMLLPLAKQGMEVWGIEPSGYFSKFSTSNGITTYNSLDELTQANPEKKFDLVMSFFVMEHVKDPLKFVKQCLELKSEQGNIVIEIPAVHDPLHSLYDFPAFERFYWSIAHHWYFSKKSLEFILNKMSVKYSIIKYQRYGLANHITWAKSGTPGGNKDLDKVFIKKIDSQYKSGLIESGFFDTMIIVI